jgi:hypothetical protein
MKLKVYLVAFLSVLLVACGGGGDSGSSQQSTTSPTTQPVDPTASVSFTASSVYINTDTLVANLTGSKNVDSWGFELNGVTGYLIVNGENVLIENNSVDVSSYAAKDFQLMLNNNTAEAVNIAVTSFTIDGKVFDLSENQYITFNAPAIVTGLLNITVQAAGTGFVAVNTTQGTPQQIEKGQVNEFLLSNLEAKLFTYIVGVEGKELHSTLDLSLIDGQQEYDIEIGDYLVEVSGIANLNGEEHVFSSTRKAEITQGGSYGVGFALTAESVTPQQVDSMANYDSTFVDGDIKNITLSDILPLDSRTLNNVTWEETPCLMSIKQDNFTLDVNSDFSIQVVFLCLSEQLFSGWQQDVNQYVQTTFDSDNMAEPVVYDINDSVLVSVNTPLSKGTTILNVSFGNVSYSDDLLNIFIKSPGLNDYGLYSPDMPIEGFGLSIKITE